MQHIEIKLYRFIATLLSITIVFASIITIQSNTGGLEQVYAASIDDDPDVNTGTVNGSGVDTSNSEVVHDNGSYDSNQYSSINPSLQGLNFVNIETIKKNSSEQKTDIKESGIYLDNSHDDYLYMYITAKSAISGTKYRTQGFMITTEEWGNHGTATNPPSVYLQVGITYSNQTIVETKMVGGNAANNNAIGKMDLKFTKSGSSFSVPNSDTGSYSDDFEGTGLIGTCYRISKADLYMAFAPYILTQKSNPTLEKNTAPLFLHSINYITTSNGNSWNGPYMTQSATVNEMSALGFSEQSRNDVSLLYNIPCSVPVPGFSFSLIDGVTGNIHINIPFTGADIKNAIDESRSGLYGVEQSGWSAFNIRLGYNNNNSTHPTIQSDGTIEANGKKFMVEGITVIPGTFRQDVQAGGVSEYAETIVKPNLANGTNDFKVKFGVDPNNKTYASKFSSYGINFLSELAPSTQIETVSGLQPSGITTSMNLNRCTTQFNSVEEASNFGLKYWNPLLGCRVYLIVQELSTVDYKGQIMCVDATTGKYLDYNNTVIDYKKDAEAKLKELIIKFSQGSDSYYTENDFYSKGFTEGSWKDLGNFKGWEVEEDAEAMYTQIPTTLKNPNGVYLELDKVEYVNNFEPDSNGEPKETWKEYINRTQLDSIKKVMNGGTPYLSDTNNQDRLDNGLDRRLHDKVVWASKMELKCTQNTYQVNNRDKTTKDFAIKYSIEHPSATKDYTGFDKYTDGRNELQGIPLYRAIYKPIAEIGIVYYDEETGTPLYQESVSPIPNQSVQPAIMKFGVTYYLHEVSYRTNTTVSDDIATTNVPVMKDDLDNGRAVANTISVPQDLVADANRGNTSAYIIRVSCGKTKTEIEVNSEWNLGEYTIGSQYLTKDFDMSVKNPDNSLSNSLSLSSKVTKLQNEELEHEYSKESGNKATCKGYKSKYNWLNNIYEWDADLSRILSPNSNLLFADKYDGNKENSLTYLKNGSGGKVTDRYTLSANSETLSGNLDFNWTSTRFYFNQFTPAFAAYMSDANEDAKKYLVNHELGGMYNEKLSSVSNEYNTAEGEADFTLTLTSKPSSKVGYHYDKYEQHNSCGEGTFVVGSGRVAPDSNNVTLGNAGGKIKSEPTYIAKDLPVAQAVNNVTGTINDNTLTYYTTPKDSTGNDAPLSFYPAYKMLIDNRGSNINAYLLGAKQRKLLPVNVTQITTNSDEILTSVNSTWSRDAVDSGKRVMKAGSVVDVKNRVPLKINVTTYTVVPKINYVESAEVLRNNMLSNHTNTINSFNNTNNYFLLSNLPESFMTNAPAGWKITNRHKTGSDNIIKSRIPDNIGTNISVGNTTSELMTLEAFENQFPNANNKERLAAQLEKNGWYVEEFDGFEVVKKTTTIEVKFSETKFINFIRNGNTDGDAGNFSDTATNAVGNIPARIHGVEFGFFNPELNLFNNRVNCERISKPDTFHVRGSLYENRT